MFQMTHTHTHIHTHTHTLKNRERDTQREKKKREREGVRNHCILQMVMLFCLLCSKGMNILVYSIIYEVRASLSAFVNHSTVSVSLDCENICI